MPTVHGFELLLESDIVELKTHARLFRHAASGAQLLSLENSDENKVFSINFRTPPADSSGVAHIMEHSVLCGSEKYPVKEPFVELMKGSLNTFLNAFTYPDKTCYPAASQNLQDFYNLVDVYADAVFHPLLTPLTLAQEGWHYELDDITAPLVYKGVVFNEMKGAYASPDSLLGRFAQRSLFPDHPYGEDSGGDPQIIPNLTYAQFKAFHETYYQPSNARIYFYGDDNPKERLRRMDKILKGFPIFRVDSSVPLQTAFSAPRRREFSYDSGELGESAKSMLVVNWLLPEITDPELRLGLELLAAILIGTPASPLRKTLIDSGLGEDLAGVGLENDLRQMYFSTGMKGINSENGDLDKVERLVVETLTRLAQEGIDPGTVAAAVNTAEFRLRENNTGSFPRGLLLMLRCLTTWLYDGDPFAPLAFEKPLGAIQDRLAAGEQYFEDLLQRFILGNTHQTTVVLAPEAGLSGRQEQAEQEKLAKIRAGLSSAELLAVLENNRRLIERQEALDRPEDLETIPSLSLNDLDRQQKLIPMESGEAGGVRTLYHDLFTNGIVYLDLGLNLRVLPQEYLPYAALFGRVLLEMGTAVRDFVGLSQHIGRSTGGIRPAFFITTPIGSSQALTWLFLRAKATSANTAEMLNILDEVLRTATLDNPERFRQIVVEEKADLESALTPAGHRLVNTRLNSFLNEAGWIDEQMGGVSHLYFLRRLLAEIDHSWPAVLAKLVDIRDLILNRESMLVNITVDQTGWQAFLPQLTPFLAALPRKPAVFPAWQFTPVVHDQGLAIPAKVNYVGKGANLFDLGYSPDGSAAVINNYLRTTWLWEKVRVQGGAYGGFCVFDHRSGSYTFLSYRDPNLAETLEIYDQTGKFLRQLDLDRLTQAELTKSIIGTIGDLDVYQHPDAKGYTSMTRYLVGEADSLRQQRRERILSTTLEDFHRFGAVLEQVETIGRVVVMGAESDLLSANIPDRRLVIEKVL